MLSVPVLLAVSFLCTLLTPWRSSHWNQSSVFRYLQVASVRWQVSPDQRFTRLHGDTDSKLSPHVLSNTVMYITCYITEITCLPDKTNVTTCVGPTVSLSLYFHNNFQKLMYNLLLYSSYEVLYFQTRLFPAKNLMFTLRIYMTCSYLCAVYSR